MLRFARAPDGGLGFDVRARLPGRGAWTCSSSVCVARALERGAFERAFDAAIIATPAALVESVRVTLEGEVSAGLGLVRRAGRLAAGRDDVARAMGEGTVTAFVLSRDLSDRTRREMIARAGDLPVAMGPAQEEVGRAIGRKPTGVLGLLGGPRAAVLLHDLQRLAAWPEPPAPVVAPPLPAPDEAGP